MLSSLIPMLAITGKPNHAQIDSILAEYNSVDINQIMLYPRSGCELEYLSEEWFSTLDYFIRQGRGYGMRFWLYDEMNWPSGSCNGLITSVPEYRLKALSKKDGTAKIVCGSGDWENRACPDMLCPEAVDLFIQNTHERYKQALGKYFGKEVIGIFTDEPGYVYESWMLSKDFTESIPYYQGMEEEFSARTGGKDLFREYERATEHDSEFFKTVTELLKNRFKSVFLAKIRHWCENNHLILTGHLFNESPLASAVQCNGNIIEQMQTVMLSGMDDIWTRLTLSGVEWDTLSSVSCAAEHNRMGGMAELFALGPCDMSFINKEKMIALCAAHRIDHYFLAVAPVDLRGNAIKDQYFNPFSSVQPWFSGLKDLNQFANRAAEFAKKQMYSETEIVYPAEEVAKMLGNPEKVWAVSAEFTAFLQGLVSEQIPWKFVLEKTGTGKFCFVIKDGHLYETNFHRQFASAKDALCWLDCRAQREIEVLDEQGDRLDDIYVKNAEDGSFILVDLQKERTKLPVVLRYRGQSVSTVLYGCLLSDFHVLQSVSEEKEIPICTDFWYTSCDFTPYRPFFKNVDSISFQAEEEFVVAAAVRQYPEPVQVIVNGKACVGTERCSCLPKGMAELYLQTELVLKQGTNTVESNPKDEINYLPSVVFLGRFDVERGGHLKRQTKKIEQQTVFYGRSEISFTALVPQSKRVRLQAENNNYFCELFAEDEKIGESVDLNSAFLIPDSFHGKQTRFVLKYYSSVSALTGEIHDVLAGYESRPDILQPPVLKWLVNN